MQISILALGGGIAVIVAALTLLYETKADSQKMLVVGGALLWFSGVFLFYIGM